MPRKRRPPTGRGKKRALPNFDEWIKKFSDSRYRRAMIASKQEFDAWAARQQEQAVGKRVRFKKKAA